MAVDCEQWQCDEKCYSRWVLPYVLEGYKVGPAHTYSFNLQLRKPTNLRLGNHRAHKKLHDNSDHVRWSYPDQLKFRRWPSSDLLPQHGPMAIYRERLLHTKWLLLAAQPATIESIIRADSDWYNFPGQCRLCDDECVCFMDCVYRYQRSLVFGQFFPDIEPFALAQNTDEWEHSGMVVNI